MESSPFSHGFLRINDVSLIYTSDKGDLGNRRTIFLHMKIEIKIRFLE